MKRIVSMALIAVMSILSTSGCSGDDRKQNAGNLKPVAATVSKKKVTFVELGSVKCIPCKMMQPIMEDIEKEYGDQVDVVFVDVWTDAGRPYAEKYGIRAIPTQVFLDGNGAEYHRHQGFFPKEELVKILKMKGVQ